MKKNFEIQFVEVYGHGVSRTSPRDEQHVTIEDHDGYFFVYECVNEVEAREVAEWFVDSEKYMNYNVVKDHEFAYYLEEAF